MVVPTATVERSKADFPLLIAASRHQITSVWPTNRPELRPLVQLTHLKNRDKVRAASSASSLGQAAKAGCLEENLWSSEPAASELCRNLQSALF